jgi:hypothetical protein
MVWGVERGVEGLGFRCHEARLRPEHGRSLALSVAVSDSAR